MNLSKLFEAQKVLRDHIGYNEPDRFNKLILALLVEIGECANEWRGFKFWSKDQEPRVNKSEPCFECDGKGVVQDRGEENYWYECHACSGDGVYISDSNPLLEEYVDGLHFVLELGLELNFNRYLLPSIVPDNVLDQFNELYYQVSYFAKFFEEYGFGCGLHDCYDDLLGNYINLGILLGFTWDQVEQAYFEKNAVNHQRQESNY